MRRNTLLLKLYDKPKPFVRGQRLQGIEQLPAGKQMVRERHFQFDKTLPSNVSPSVREVADPRLRKTHAQAKTYSNPAIAGVSANSAGQIEGTVTRLGVQHAGFPGDAARPTGEPVPYEPEREAEVVAEVEFASSGAKLRVICGDLRHSDAEAVAVMTDKDMRGEGPEALHFLMHTELQGRHMYGDRFTGVLEQASAHYDKFGTIPMGCVGRLDGAAAQKAVLCLHAPRYVDGHRHESRWLESLYVNVLEECRFLELESLALTCPADFPLQVSAPILARSLVDWLELECLHHNHASNVTVYTQTLEEARRVAECITKAQESV